MKNLERTRTLNAILFFAKNTAYCGKIKLFKLLYMLDFEHFRQTGRRVTGYNYQAWKFGPVPAGLMEEWEMFEQDMASLVHVKNEKVIDYERQTVKANPGAEFDEGHFTPRQLSIMQALAEQFKQTRSGTMIDVTHAQNGAWDTIWDGGKGAQKEIPYELAIPDQASDRDYILESADAARGLSAAIPASDY